MPYVRNGGPQDESRTKSGSTQPKVPLSVTVPPHASQGPSETLISHPAKPFSLHWLLPGYMVKSLPSSNQGTDKPSLALTPYLSSILLSPTPQNRPHYLSLLPKKTSSGLSSSSSWAHSWTTSPSLPRGLLWPPTQVLATGRSGRERAPCTPVSPSSGVLWALLELA